MGRSLHLRGAACLTLSRLARCTVRVMLTPDEAAQLAALNAKAADDGADAGAVAGEVGAATAGAVAEVASTVAAVVADAVQDAQRHADAVAADKARETDETVQRAENAAELASEAAAVAVDAAVVAIEETADDAEPAQVESDELVIDDAGAGDGVVIVDDPVAVVVPDAGAVTVEADSVPKGSEHWYTRPRGGLFGRLFS